MVGKQLIDNFVSTPIETATDSTKGNIMKIYLGKHYFSTWILNVKRKLDEHFRSNFNAA